MDSIVGNIIFIAIITAALGSHVVCNKLALFNVIEVKTTRLERGADLAKLQSQTQKIYEQEKKLFGLKEDN